jgi:DNA-binding response OmpR family regulator
MMKILVIEDNERVSQFVKKGLAEAGHTVDHAENAGTGCSSPPVRLTTRSSWTACCLAQSMGSP